MKVFTFTAMLAVLVYVGAPIEAAAKTAPDSGMIDVAVVLSDSIQVIAFAGPWEVFQDVSIKNSHGKTFRPYHLYTVAPTNGSMHTTGANGPGMTMTPDYTFADAPIPDIVVLAPQAGGPGLIAWLKRLHGEHKTIMSVGQGARTLARAGLLDGKNATLHHFDFGMLAHEFPNINVVRQVRYVRADPTTFTAAGMTSGIDLALHLVAKRFGQKVAQRTADYMEYMCTGWKTNKAKAFPLPVSRQVWLGKLPSGALVVQHLVIRGGSIESVTTDIPDWDVVAAPTSMKHEEDHELIYTFRVNSQTAVFTGRLRSTDEGPEISGKLALHEGKSYPLTLRKSDADVAQAESSTAKQ